MANENEQPMSVDRILDSQWYSRCKGITLQGASCRNPIHKDTQKTIATLLPEVDRAWRDGDHDGLHVLLSQIVTHSLCRRDHQRLPDQQDYLMERLILAFDFAPLPDAVDVDEALRDHAGVIEDQADSRPNSPANGLDLNHDARPEGTDPAAGADNVRDEDGEEILEAGEEPVNNDELNNERLPESEQSQNLENNEDVESDAEHNATPDWLGPRRSTRSNDSRNTQNLPRSESSENHSDRAQPSPRSTHVPSSLGSTGARGSRRSQVRPLRSPLTQPRRNQAPPRYPERHEGDSVNEDNGIDDFYSDNDDYEEGDYDDPYEAAVNRNRSLEDRLYEERSLVQLLLEEHTDMQSSQVRFSRVRDAYYRHAQDFSDYQPSFSQRYGGDILQRRDLDPMYYPQEKFHHTSRPHRSTRPTPEFVPNSYHTPPHSRRADPRTPPPPRRQCDRSPLRPMPNIPLSRPREFRGCTYEDRPRREYGRPRDLRSVDTDSLDGRSTRRRFDGRTEREI